MVASSNGSSTGPQRFASPGRLTGSARFVARLFLDQHQKPFRSHVVRTSLTVDVTRLFRSQLAALLKTSKVYFASLICWPESAAPRQVRSPVRTRDLSGLAASPSSRIQNLITSCPRAQPSVPTWIRRHVQADFIIGSKHPSLFETAPRPALDFPMLCAMLTL